MHVCRKVLFRRVPATDLRDGCILAPKLSDGVTVPVNRSPRGRL